MLPLLKVLAVFGLIVFLLRRNYNIGWTMLAGAAVLGLVFGLGPVPLVRQLGLTLINPLTVSLMAILVLIMIMESVMRKTGMMDAMTGALFHLPVNRRVIFAAIPAIIGLLPSAGGARFSAPLVARATEGFPYRAEDRVFINYWFRHVWEFSLPLYPGLILAAHISGVSMGTIILWQWPFTIAWFVLGYWYFFKIKRGGRTDDLEEHRAAAGEGHAGPDPARAAEGENRASNGHSLRTLVVSTWPLWLTVLLVLVHAPMVWTLCGVLALLTGLKRYPLRQVWRNLREPMTIKIVILIWGIMSFKDILVLSGAVAQVSDAIMVLGVPVVLVTIMLPLLIGVLTGLLQACIGVSFPLVMSVVEPTVAYVMLAYVAGVVGVMLSPVHLCLVLTVEYFRADFFRCYRPLLAPSLLVMAGAAGLFWFM